MTLDNTIATIRGSTGHRCPWWLGWALVFPLRRWVENPDRLLGPWVTPGSQVLEVGPGMGFFTTYLAARVGPTGRVFCVDVEARMLRSLGHRLERRGLEGRVALRQCGTESLGLDDLAGRVDCAVLIHVLHEIPDPRTALREIASAVRPQGRLVLIEPPGHVSRQQFEAELAIAGEVGFTRIETATHAFGRRHAAVFERER